MRYFEIKIPKLIEIDIIVEQIIGFDSSVYPMRVILAKKVGENFYEYVGGKGQMVSKTYIE